MKPAAFDYIVADSVDAAVAALAAAGGDAKIIAGGQSLAPMMHVRLAHSVSLFSRPSISALSCSQTRRSALKG